MRSDLEAILRAALSAADPGRAVRQHVRREGDTLILSDGARYDLAACPAVVLIAAGKAAWSMAQAVIPLVADRLRRMVVVTKYGHLPADAAARAPDFAALIESGHPTPDENSVRGGTAVRAALTDLAPDSLVIVCVSGGASALLLAPHPGISLNTARAINDALLRSGADITEMNAVRGRLDRLKAGGLARLAAPAAVVGLVVSDVIGDSLSVIASGLTHDPAARNVLVANNAQACAAAAAAAAAQGYTARVVTTALSGEARDVAGRIVAALRAVPAGTALIYGGETTVTLRGTGKGGRNQELALAAAIALAEGPSAGMTIASFGTDGTDGPTDAAGAWADAGTLTRAAALGLDARAALTRNDSYPFFAALGDLILTGPTGTNVADVVVALRQV